MVCLCCEVGMACFGVEFSGMELWQEGLLVADVPLLALHSEGPGKGLTLWVGCGMLGRKARLPGRLHTVLAKAATGCEVDCGGFFLLFVLKVRKSGDNSSCHGGDTGHQSDDKFSCHTQAPLHSSIPAEAGRVSGDNRRKESGPSSGSSIAWSACAVKWGWRALGQGSPGWSVARGIGRNTRRLP